MTMVLDGPYVLTGAHKAPGAWFQANEAIASDHLGLTNKLWLFLCFTEHTMAVYTDLPVDANFSPPLASHPPPIKINP